MATCNGPLEFFEGILLDHLLPAFRPGYKDLSEEGRGALTPGSLVDPRTALLLLLVPQALPRGLPLGVLGPLPAQPGGAPPGAEATGLHVHRLASETEFFVRLTPEKLLRSLYVV
ncbi:UNVERIFIED_CONTAM: hypothetical protein K2H54_002111, partial [Gekko kuhli]